jgi:uncharacterized protein (UPF0212 family)
MNFLFIADEISYRLRPLRPDCHTCNVHEKSIVILRVVCVETLFGLRVFSASNPERAARERIFK